ncbi:hypothetical protein V6N13_001227 [Hibiscus sabdariffa]|uniref:Uncharacterized protein n=1 Tax=Hibiscus sabdariffa TaxID=183260 RepID=A0ABR2G7P5_9ROSI
MEKRGKEYFIGFDLVRWRSYNESSDEHKLWSKKDEKQEEIDDQKELGQPEPCHMKSEMRQQSYSSKLVQALSQLNLNSSPPPSPISSPRAGRVVREPDRVGPLA